MKETQKELIGKFKTEVKEKVKKEAPVSVEEPKNLAASDIVESPAIVEVEEKAETPIVNAPMYKLEQLREGCVEGARLNKAVEIKSLLNEKYKIAKLDELPESQFENFAQDLRDLGVRI